MAMRWMDGFDKYQTTNTDITSDISRIYTFSGDGSVSTKNGRYTGKSASIVSYGTGTFITKSISSSGVSKFIIGFNINADSQTTGDFGSFWISPSNATGNGSYQANRGLTFCRNGRVFYNSGQTAGQDLGLIASGWIHIEMVIPMSPGIGNPTIIYKNGIEIYNSTDATSSFGWNDFLKIGYPPNGINGGYMIDDLYILDDTGTRNNSRVSTLTYVPRIETLVPTSTVANDFSLTGVASAHLAGDNIPHNSSQYVSSTTNDNKVRFGVGDLTNINNIKAVQINSLCANSDVTTDSYKLLMNNTEIGTTKTVTNALISTTPIDYELLETNPITSSAWTVSDVNSIEIGIINK